MHTFRISRLYTTPKLYKKTWILAKYDPFIKMIYLFVKLNVAINLLCTAYNFVFTSRWPSQSKHVVMNRKHWEQIFSCDMTGYFNIVDIPHTVQVVSCLYGFPYFHTSLKLWSSFAHHVLTCMEVSTACRLDLFCGRKCGFSFVSLTITIPLLKIQHTQRHVLS